MNENKKTKQVETKIFKGIGYLLLVGAAFCTMIPMLWLLTSSFKTANEIFAVPIQWFPSFPPRISASPYTVENAYRNIERPEAVDETAWETLVPELTEAVWKQAQGHIAANPQLSNYVPSEELQAEITEGLWQQLVTGLPAEIWMGSTSAIMAAVEAAIIPEAVDTIWSSVYREVAVGNLQIEALDFNRPSIAPVQWEADTGTRIRTSADSQTASNISYEFGDDKTVGMTAIISSPIPVEQIRRIILPVRGDASYHHLNLTVSMPRNGSITYQPARPFILESALWKDAVWRLHGTPSGLESSHITMQQHVETDITTQSTAETGPGSQLRLQLTIHQPVTYPLCGISLPQTTETSGKPFPTIGISSTVFSLPPPQRY